MCRNARLLSTAVEQLVLGHPQERFEGIARCRASRRHPASPVGYLAARRRKLLPFSPLGDMDRIAQLRPLGMLKQRPLGISRTKPPVVPCCSGMPEICEE